MSNHTQQSEKRIEKIQIPQLLSMTLRPSPPSICADGWRGYVNEPESEHNNTLVLFPRDGIEMDLLPHQVAFIAVTDVIVKESRSGANYLYGTPIGSRSFADPIKGRDQARAIVRDDIEKFLEKRAAARGANKAFEDLDRMNKIPFVTANNPHFPLSGFDLAIGQADIEKIGQFVDLFMHIQKPHAPTGLIIGGRLALGGRHDTVLCVAHPEMAAMAAAYLTSLGWWVVSAYLSPNQDKWAFVMTSSPQAAWDYSPMVRQQQKNRAPQREAAPAKPHVPAVARPKPVAVLNGLGALGGVADLIQVVKETPAAPAVLVSEVVVDQVPPAPVTHENVYAMVVAQPAMPSFTAQQPISEEEMGQAMDFIGQADHEEIELMLFALCYMSHNGIGKLHPSVISVIEEKLRPEAPTTITAEQQAQLGEITIPMFCNATPGWVAAVTSEIATIQEVA